MTLSSGARWYRIHTVVLLLGAAIALTNADLRGSNRLTQAAGSAGLFLRLIDADTDQPIAGYDPLPVSSTIDVSTLPSSNLNVEAIVADENTTVGSIQWNHNGNVRVEGFARWALCGNSGSDFFTCNGLKVGTNNTISATPFTGPQGTGTAGPTVTIQLVLSNSGAPVALAPTLTLINADTDEDIGPLVNGSVIDVSQTPFINVRANPLDIRTDSIVFYYDGSLVRVENNAPYAMHGNQGRNYLSWTPTAGRHTITSVTFASDNAQGQALSSVTIAFDVRVPTPAPAPPTALNPTRAPGMPPTPIALELLNMTLLSPSRVDLANGPVEVHFEITARDNKPNLIGAWVRAQCSGEPVGSGTGTYTVYSNDAPINAAANTAITLKRTLFFPKYFVPSGPCALNVLLFDDKGSESGITDSIALGFLGFPSQLTVVNSQGRYLTSVKATSNTTIVSGQSVQFEIVADAQYTPKLDFGGESVVPPYETILGPGNRATHRYTMPFDFTMFDPPSPLPGDYPFGLLIETSLGSLRFLYFNTLDLMALGFSSVVTVVSN